MGIQFIKCIFIVLVLVGCSAPFFIPTEQDIALASVNGKDTTLDELTKGRTVYVNNCGKCHALFKPTGFSEEKWKKIVPVMALKAKITEAEGDQVLKYMLVIREAELNRSTNK